MEYSLYITFSNGKGETLHYDNHAELLTAFREHVACTNVHKAIAEISDEYGNTLHSYQFAHYGRD